VAVNEKAIALGAMAFRDRSAKAFKKKPAGARMPSDA
jgi:hypothetical protein